MRDLVVVGAGGFGRETIDTVRAINAVEPTWRLLGVVDDGPSDADVTRIDALGVPLLGRLADIPKGAAVAVGVGSPSARRRIVELLRAAGHAFPSLVHPSTTVGSNHRQGEGVITLAGVSIGTNVDLGDHVHLNAHAVVGHDTQLLDHVSVNPNATVSGACRVGPSALVGAAAVVLQGLTVGRGTTVGAGAVVTRDVPDDAVVKGVPAR